MTIADFNKALPTIEALYIRHSGESRFSRGRSPDSEIWLVAHTLKCIQPRLASLSPALPDDSSFNSEQQGGGSIARRQRGWGWGVTLKGGGGVVNGGWVDA